MCGERFDGSIDCWDEGTDFPDIDNPAPTSENILATTELDMDARVYGQSVEVFWTPIVAPPTLTPRVQVFRNGELLDTVLARFSYFDVSALPVNRYQIRLIDNAGNVGPLSDVLDVELETNLVLFNGESPVTAAIADIPGADSIIEELRSTQIANGYIVYWTVDPDLESEVDGYLVRVGGETQGFTRSRLFVETNASLGGRCIEVIAVDASGAALDSIESDFACR